MTREDYRVFLSKLFGGYELTLTEHRLIDHCEKLGLITIVSQRIVPLNYE